MGHQGEEQPPAHGPVVLVLNGVERVLDLLQSVIGPVHFGIVARLGNIESAPQYIARAEETDPHDKREQACDCDPSPLKCGSRHISG